MERAAGILLAGGRSTRMGGPKAELAWGGTTLAAHLAGVLGEAVSGPVVVVRAPGQPLAGLPTEVEVVDDRRPGRGPLEGLAAGLAAVADRAEAAFVSGVDAPHLQPAFVRRLLAAVGDAEAAVPCREGRVHPLAAAYSVAPALAAAERLLARGELRARALVEELDARLLDPEDLLADRELAAADPELRALDNVNTPEEYAAALARAQAGQASSAIRSGWE
jgi:molybdopterin-guanine dinucleotide biosynthesis protein A